MGCQYSLQKSQSNKNFQNELTNLKPIIMFNPSLSFISKRFCRTINTCGHLKDHAINEFSWVVTIVTDHAKHCHLAVTCPVKVATVKTIAIAGYLPHQIIRKQFWWLCDKKRVVKTIHTAYRGSFWMQFCVSRDSLTDITDVTVPSIITKWPIWCLVSCSIEYMLRMCSYVRVKCWDVITYS